MPGRFLVFMPTVDHVGVSRKIESREERGRLRGIVREFRDAHGFTGGVIIRTAAAGRPKEDIVSDLDAFHVIWTEIRHKMESSRAPASVYREQSPSASCSATSSPTSSRPSASTIKGRQRVLDLVQRILAQPGARVKLYPSRFPFDDTACRPRSTRRSRARWLKSGGSIVINQTEALSRSTGTRAARREENKRPARRHHRQDEPEAVQEIVCRALAIRASSPDFIDMGRRRTARRSSRRSNRSSKRIDRRPRPCRCRTSLVIITRKRVKQSLSASSLSRPILSVRVSSNRARRSAGDSERDQENRPDLNGHRILRVIRHARALKEEESDVLRDLKQSLGK
jgi:ribonuclease G